MLCVILDLGQLLTLVKLIRSHKNYITLRAELDGGKEVSKCSIYLTALQQSYPCSQKS